MSLPTSFDCHVLGHSSAPGWSAASNPPLIAVIIIWLGAISKSLVVRGETLLEREVRGLPSVLLAGMLFDCVLVTAAVSTSHMMLKTWSSSLGLLMIFGGLYLVVFSFRSLFKKRPPQCPAAATPTSDFASAFCTQAANPNPYIFWSGIGGPLVVSLWARHDHQMAVLAPLVFLSVVYALKGLTGVVLRQGGRTFLSGYGYKWALKGLACAQLYFAVIFIERGTRMLA